MKLEVGQQAPDFTLESTQGEISLHELCAKASKGVVVYFYPRAMTPGCTKEACDFRDNLNTFAAAGYLVIGISPDDVVRLEKFAQRDSLNFPLASDPDHRVMEEWGTFGEKKNYGRIVHGVIRSTFVCSPSGELTHVAYNVKATGHVARLRSQLGIDEE